MLRMPCWRRAQRLPKQQQSVKVSMLNCMPSEFHMYRRSSVLLRNKTAKQMPSSVCSAGALSVLFALSVSSSVMVRSSAATLPRTVAISKERETAAKGILQQNRTLCTMAPARTVTRTKCSMLRQCHHQSSTALSDADCAQADEHRIWNVE